MSPAELILTTDRVKLTVVDPVRLTKPVGFPYMELILAPPGNVVPVGNVIVTVLAGITIVSDRTMEKLKGTGVLTNIVELDVIDTATVLGCSPVTDTLQVSIWLVPLYEMIVN